MTWTEISRPNEEIDEKVVRRASNPCPDKRFISSDALRGLWDPFLKNHGVSVVRRADRCDPP